MDPIRGSKLSLALLRLLFEGSLLFALTSALLQWRRVAVSHEFANRLSRGCHCHVNSSSCATVGALQPTQLHLAHPARCIHVETELICLLQLRVLY